MSKEVLDIWNSRGDIAENLLAEAAARRSISLAELAETLEDMNPRDLEKYWGVSKKVLIEIVDNMVRLDREEIIRIRKQEYAERWESITLASYSMIQQPLGLPRYAYLYAVQDYERRTGGPSKEDILCEKPAFLHPGLRWVLVERHHYTPNVPNDGYLSGLIDESGSWVRCLGSMHSSNQAKRMAVLGGYLGWEDMPCPTH